MQPIEFRTKPMRKDNNAYSGSYRIMRIEFRTKPIRRDAAHCRFTDKMMLFDAMRGSKNYTISKILVRNIFPAHEGQPIILYTSRNRFRVRWSNFTVL